MKTAFDSSYDYVAYDLVKTRLSASQAEAVELNQLQSRRLRDWSKSIGGGGPEQRGGGS